MRCIKTILTLAIILSCSKFHASKAVISDNNDLYFGKKRGVLSSATFFLKVKDSIAFLEQYREYGGVLHRDLLDTMHLKNEHHFVGGKTYIELTNNGFLLKNIKGKLPWKLNVKMNLCSTEEHKRYNIYQNRLLLDSLDFHDLPMSIYRPLVDKAFIMDHEKFQVEVNDFICKYGLKK